jgi:cardiolipin synthase (CMP-forming)
MNTAPHARVRITPATWITIARLVGVFVFILLLTYHSLELKQGSTDSAFRVWALGLFVVVAATDFLDGWLARRRGEVTPLGTFLDPVADKLLVVSSLVMLTKPSLPALSPQFPVWFTWLVISRDVYLFAGAVLVHATGAKLNIRPRQIGKLATLLNLVAITFVLGRISGLALNMALYLAAAATIWSWFQYTIDGLPQAHLDQKN